MMQFSTDFVSCDDLRRYGVCITATLQYEAFYRGVRQLLVVLIQSVWGDENVSI